MTIRSCTRRFFRRLGFDLRPLTSVPFGVDWRWDLRAVTNDHDRGCMLDVGANQGQTALKLASEFPNCQIYSFEPVRSTFDMLCNTTRSNARITAVNSAVGETVGTIEITNDPGSCSNTTVRQTQTKALTTVFVPLTTIDDFCEQRAILSVRLLKIDVEGAELSVLKGAQRMLDAGNIHAILAECEFSRRADEPHGTFDEIWPFLQQCGYRICAFYSGGVDRMGWIWGDCLFVRDGHGPAQVVCSPWASHLNTY